MTFWEKLGAWFTNFFKNIGLFFIGQPEEEGASEIVFSGFEKAIICIFIVLISYIIIKFITFLLKRAFKLHKKGPQIDVSARSFAVSAIKGFLWLLVAFIIVNVLGLDLGSFAGIISAVTVALGLALQDLISSFAAGIIIINSKNFATGDYIQVNNGFGKVEGSVTKINLFFTLLRTADGQKIIISNSNVLKANVLDYSAEPYRRFNFMVTVSYDSDIEKVKTVLKDLLASDDRINKTDLLPDIHIGEFGQYGIQIAIKGWAKTELYWSTYNGLREKILIAFRENNIKMPIYTISVIKEEEAA